MADANTEIDIDALHQAIIDAIRAQFPQLATVDDYPADRRRIIAPAVIVELDEFEGGQPDPGTEQLAVLARWSARVIVGFKAPAAKRYVRKLTGHIAAFIRLQRWGLPVGPAQIIGCYPDDFEPELDQFEVWRIEWEQAVNLDKTIWTEGFPPAEVWLGIAPDIGPPNVDKYTLIARGPEPEPAP